MPKALRFVLTHEVIITYWMWRIFHFSFIQMCASGNVDNVPRKTQDLWSYKAQSQRALNHMLYSGVAYTILHYRYWLTWTLIFKLNNLTTSRAITQHSTCLLGNGLHSPAAFSVNSCGCTDATLKLYLMDWESCKFSCGFPIFSCMFSLYESCI